MSKNVAQKGNVGFGATQADLERGYIKVEQPPIYDDPHPQRVSFFEESPSGFINRSIYSNERT